LEKKTVIKIAIVVPSLVIGGAENMAAQLAANIDKNRFCVELLVMSSPKETNIEKTVKDAGVKTVYFNKELGFSIKTLWVVYKYLNQFKPDVVHTHLSGCVYAIPWALLHGVTMLHTIHNRPIYEVEGSIRRVLKFLYKKRRAVPVAISNIIARETADLYNISPDLVETIFNPVDVARFTARLKKRAQDNKVVFVSVGRFSPQKNHIGLVEAFSCVSKELPVARLVLIGDGELKLIVEKKVEQLGLKDKVEFTGNVADIPQRLARADVFVLPSHYEGLPMSILEAMAAGLPVIATAVGGIPDIVKENGILVNAGDMKGLVDAMIKLGKDEELRKKMGEKALAEVIKYDLPEVTAQYERLYERYRK
jgi:glycosyltransferase involved in cell wall biosynthesis